MKNNEKLNISIILPCNINEEQMYIEISEVFELIFSYERIIWILLYVLFVCN